MMPTYSNPDHPEHKNWLVARRKRFTSILREGKRAVRLEDDERKLVIELCDKVDRRTREIERE